MFQYIHDWLMKSLQCDARRKNVAYAISQFQVRRFAPSRGAQDDTLNNFYLGVLTQNSKRCTPPIRWVCEDSSNMQRIQCNQAAAAAGPPRAGLGSVEPGGQVTRTFKLGNSLGRTP